MHVYVQTIALELNDRWPRYLAR